MFYLFKYLKFFAIKMNACLFFSLLKFLFEFDSYNYSIFKLHGISILKKYDFNLAQTKVLFSKKENH